MKELCRNKGNTLKLAPTTWAMTGCQGKAKPFQKQNKGVKSNASLPGPTTLLMHFAFVHFDKRLFWPFLMVRETGSLKH